jgi:hypothetical protein
MTESRDPAGRRRTRLSKGRVRAVAWVTGVTTFLTGWGILGLAPKESSSATTVTRASRPVIVVRKVLRRVIIPDPVASAPVRYVTAPGLSTSSSGGASVSVASPPTTTTSGS